MNKKNVALLSGLIYLSLLPTRVNGDAAVDVVMSLQVLDVQSISGTLQVPVNVGDNLILSQAVLRNSGNVNEDYAVKVTSDSASVNWVQITTQTLALGRNQYRLRGIWHQSTANPVKAEFQANDVITRSNLTSSATLFFNDIDTHTVVGQQGFNVAPGADRSLLLWVEGPAAGSLVGTLKLFVTVTALATP